MNKKIILLLSVLCLIIPFNVFAKEYKTVIEDNANLLKKEELAKLEDQIAPLTEYGHIAFVTTSDNEQSAESYAREYYHTNFGVENGTLFLIDMSNRKIYIFSDGENYKAVTTSKANIITDNIYKYASNKQYYECAKEAFIEIEAVLAGQKIKQPMKYISNAILSLIIATLIGFKKATKKFKLQNQSANNELKKNITSQFEASNVVATKTGQKEKYNPKSSSSGSYGGGGGGGGGFSSGGGGGHSF